MANADVPDEIKANTEREVEVYWQMSTDDWDKPQHFVVLDSREARRLDGRYRFFIRYALEPWALGFQHKATYFVTSPEFVIVPS